MKQPLVYFPSLYVIFCIVNLSLLKRACPQMNFLLHNATAYAKVRDEVDRVLGDQPIRLEHVGKLQYIAGKYEALPPGW